MANNTDLKAAIQAVIKANGNNEITGPVLQSSLLSIINQLGQGSQFMGLASPSTIPVTTDGNLFYIAFTPGTYTGFGGYNLVDKPVFFINKTGAWVASDLDFASYASIDNVKRSLNKYPYSKDFPFSQTVINEGSDKFLIDAYLDITYDLGFDYSIAIAYKSTKRCRFFKHDSSIVPATSPSITSLGTFVVDYEVGRFTVMKPTVESASTLKNSVLVVDWNAISADYTNRYAYDGLGISPICFFNDLLARRLQTQVTALSGEVSALDFKFSQVFEIEIENQITWPSNSFTNNNMSSTFSGWGCKIGAYTGFNYAEVWVKNRDVTPITQLRIALARNSRSGAIVADKTITVNVAPGEEKKIGVIFDSAVNNPEGDILHLMYWCNKLVTRKGYGGSYPYTTTAGYSADTYATSGGMVNQVDGSGKGYPFYFKIGTVSSDGKFFLTNEQIDNIAGRLDLPTSSLDISLPNRLYAVVGDKLQLFFRGMIKDIDIYKYDILVTCSRGQKYPRYFEFTPVLADVGTYNFKVEVKDKDGVILGSKTCQIIVRNAVQSPASNTVFLNVGDSLTSANAWGIEAHRRLTGSGGTPAGLGLTNISFRGRKTGSGIGWEGNGGWTWTSYATAGAAAFRFDVSGVVTVPSINSVYTNNGQTFTVAEVNITSGSGYIRCLSTGSPLASGVLTKTSGGGDATINFSASTADAGNPFWNNGALDFPNYVNTYMGGQVDCIFFLLTWNGQTPHRTDFSAIINTAKILVDHIHTNYPNCKMKIMGVQLPSLNGGMGYNYGATGTSYADGYGMVVTALNMNKAYQDWCNDPAYSSFLEFVNVSSQVDSEYNMPASQTPVNSRSTITELRGTNGVHPNNDGYLQIGDVQFRNIVANYCQ